MLEMIEPIIYYKNPMASQKCMQLTCHITEVLKLYPVTKNNVIFYDYHFFAV